MVISSGGYGDDASGHRRQQPRLAGPVSLALLVGAGLRRDEAVHLEFADVRRQPIREKVRTVLQVRGKGAKDRVVPISEQLTGMLVFLAR